MKTGVFPDIFFPSPEFKGAEFFSHRPNFMAIWPALPWLARNLPVIFLDCAFSDPGKKYPRSNKSTFSSISRAVVGKMTIFDL
jgi:hypothetical protein